MLMKLVEDGRLARELAVLTAPGALASMKQFTMTAMDYKRKERTIQFVVIT